MKNIFKISGLCIMLLITLQSCTKSKVEQMNEFVNVYNTSIASNSMNNGTISSTAEISGDNEITIDIVSKSSDDFENNLLSSSMPDALEAALTEEEICKDLVAKGVQLKIMVLNENGKILNSKILDLTKTKSENETLTDKPKNEQLRIMLEAFNKNLPQTDKETGIKMLKIKLGDNNDIIYTGEVPEDMVSLFKMKENIILIKDDLVKNPQIKNVLQSTSNFNINKIKYQYNDSKGKNIAEIIITKKDLQL